MTDDPPPKQRAVVLPPRPEWVLRRIRSIAEKTERIQFSLHAQERGAERDIFDHGALVVIRKGNIVGEIEVTGYGELKCKIIWRLRGNRDAGVVLLVQPDDTLFVMTVEWEDVP